MQPLKCRHRGCTTAHKSSTGYCAEHVEEGVRRRTHVPKFQRTVSEPHLVEEDTRGFTLPKVI